MRVITESEGVTVLQLPSGDYRVKAPSHRSVVYGAVPTEALLAIVADRLIGKRDVEDDDRERDWLQAAIERVVSVRLCIEPTRSKQEEER